MSSPCRCAGAIIAKPIAAAMKPHGGKMPALIRPSPPELCGWRPIPCRQFRTRWTSIDRPPRPASAPIREIPRAIGRSANGGRIAKPTQLSRWTSMTSGDGIAAASPCSGLKTSGLRVRQEASFAPIGAILTRWISKLVRRGKFPPDEYGFAVDPELARELRDSKLKLACLKLDKKRTPYAIAQEARIFHARIEEIRRSLQCPCPSRYGRKQLKSDNERLKIFGDWRVQKNLFPPEEDLEEDASNGKA